jgi:hypothetical protein
MGRNRNMTADEDIPGASTCSLRVTRGTLERLHYDEEPGRGFTQESLLKHIAECEPCRARMSLIARGDELLKKEYEKVSNHTATLAHESQESRLSADREYEEFRREAERLRGEILSVESVSTEAREVNATRAAESAREVGVARKAGTDREAAYQAVFAELNLARMRGLLQDKEALTGRVAPLVASIVTVLDQILRIESGPIQLALLERLAVVCRECLKAMAPQLEDREKVLDHAHLGQSKIQSYSLEEPDTLEIALLVASNPEALRKSEQPILRVASDALLFDQVAYAAAGAA